MTITLTEGEQRTIDEVIAAIDTADKLADAVLPFTPVAAIAPLIDGVTRLLEKLQAAVEGRGQAPAAEVAAADVAVNAAEDAKFPVGSK